MLKRVILYLLLIIITHDVFSQQPMDKMWGGQASKTTEAERGQLFNSHYAMFIHWGLFSKLANRWDGKTYYGIGEWLMNSNMANIPVDEYRTVAKDFNPTMFNARQIAKLAKDAGMKYIIITAKHHDGFAMYRSQCNKFNIVDGTPFKRDPMKELSEACKEQGLGFGFYYSHNQDWTYPGGTGGPKTDDKGNPKTFDDYFAEKCLPQVEEITRNYGDMVLIWFDTPGKMPAKYAKQLVDVVRRNQPKALVSGRVGYDMGDYQTFGDMEVPLENMEGLWESVDVTNDSWGFAWYDENWKSPQKILTLLISTVARGGTYMLNIGPDGLGRVPEPAQESLLSAGKWIADYPQIIYSAKPSPWKHALPWGDAVVNNGKLYLTIYDWPSTGKLYLPGLKSEIDSANLLKNDRPEKLTFTNDGTWVIFDVPFHAPDRMVSVIELTIKGDPEVDPSQAVDPEFGLTMSTKFGKATDCSVTKKSWMEKFGEWKHIYQVGDWKKESKIAWECEVKTPGRYLVELTCSGNGPKVWKAETDEGVTIQNRQNSCSIYNTQPIGWILFNKAGKHIVTVSMPEDDRDNTSLSAIKITPVDF